MATGFNPKDPGATFEQYAAWAYYGMPATIVTPGALAKRKSVACAVGEVRYVVGWMADQMSRMDWTVIIDGEPGWSLDAGGETITSDPDADPDDPTHPRAASAALLARVGWDESVVRMLTTNLFVAGQCDYTATSPTSSKDEAESWRVVSVIHPERNQLLADAAIAVPCLWPHPADPDAPDAPLFGVLDVLEELVWLSLVSRSQSRNRAGMRGIVTTADSVEFANGGNFWDAWNQALQAEIKDPGAMGPISLRASSDLMDSRRGPVDWLVPDLPYDQRIDDRIAAAIRRLAYGLPIPPELLLGLQAPSRATAEFFDADRYRSHIEPVANLVAEVARAALEFILPDTVIAVEPDPTEMLAKRSSVADAFAAFDRRAIGFSYLREVLGIPEDAELDEDDLSLMIRLGWLEPGGQAVPVGGATPPTSPTAAGALVAPVVGSVGGPDDPALTQQDLTGLTNDLALIDATLMAELGGLTQQATERARERLGAKARTRDDLRATVPRQVPNDQVGAYLGAGALVAAGVPVDDVITQALTGLEAWWRRRVETVQAQITDLLGPDAAPVWEPADVDASVAALIDATSAHVLDTLDSEAAEPLPADQRERVLTIAGGG